MNSAERLANILKKAKKSQKRTAFETFEEVFDVHGCVAVVNKLRMCEAQMSVLAKKSDKNLIAFLYKTFNCRKLERDITNERQEFSVYIMTLNTVAAYMPNEKINKDDLAALAEMLLKMEDIAKNLDISDEYMSIFNNYLAEMREALIDIHIGGIEAFEKHIIIANGTVVLYNDAFVHKELSEMANKIFKKSTEIISDASTWAGALGYGIGLLTNH